MQTRHNEEKSNAERGHETTFFSGQVKENNSMNWSRVMAALEAVNTVLNQLAESPLDIDLHKKHIDLAAATSDPANLQAAWELLTAELAAPDDVWLPLIAAKLESVDLSNSEDVENILSLFLRAEGDYLSIPILHKHLEFLISTHNEYKSGTMKPADLGEQFSTEWTRFAIEDAIEPGLVHPHRGQILWTTWIEWELEQLAEAPASEKPSLVERIEKIHLDRLKLPHSASDETMQSYSTFTTNHKPQDKYEEFLVSASKLKTYASKGFQRREAQEYATLNNAQSLTAFATLLQTMRRSSKPDKDIVSNAYERAISEAARRRFNASGLGTAILHAAMRVCPALKEISIHKRAVRSIPGSGEVWARYMRLVERLEGLESAPELDSSVSDLFTSAISTQLVDKDVEQIVPVILARAGYEKRHLESDEDALTELITVLESGIGMVLQASSSGDPKYRLQKYLAGLYSGPLDLTSNAIEVWANATKQYKSSYVAWIAYTDSLIKTDRFDDARAVFIEAHTKHLDWPEAIYEAWLAFEHLYGSMEDLEACNDKIEKAQNILNVKRAKEAEKAHYQAMQAYASQQAAAPVSDAPSADIAMDVDQGGSHKKVKLDAPSAPLKRDRENSTVFVGDLPQDATEENLKALFKDCGEIREIKITTYPHGPVATVEFMDRSSVPAALTKDKKRINDQELNVHLAWQSTLYVTNFPEKTDDAAMRDMFGQFGTILDVRWPSKKYKATRRFCYVQFTSPKAAQASLVLHGKELEPGHAMDVLISNPERKKARSDQAANEKELYVAGLSKFTTQVDLEKVFKTYGNLKEVRVALDHEGKCKGFAFVEFSEPDEATPVTLVDPKARGRSKMEENSKNKSEYENRSVHVYNLPDGTQEGLLQQVLEKIAKIKRVEVLSDTNEALVELENASEAGKLLLRLEPIIFQDVELKIVEVRETKKPSAPPPKAGGMFVPRAATTSRPRAGLGHTRKAPAAATSRGPRQEAQSGGDASSSQPKGQNDFRKMLGGS
ncbi:hypothetical protein DL96DRAFT_1737005 [Flagelloscypha sp. PMI_526]|nr:hypothetical protein DL96DRAFT_1737005 [Flagelloscypha sp. PMI_526]